MLFGDRLPVGALRQEGASRHLLQDADTHDALLDLAMLIGVNLVSGPG